MGSRHIRSLSRLDVSARSAGPVGVGRWPHPELQPLLLSKEAAKGEMCREPCAKCYCDERQHDELPSLQKVHATSSAKEEWDCSRAPVPAANAGSTTMPRERASSSAHRHG